MGTPPHSLDLASVLSQSLIIIPHASFFILIFIFFCIISFITLSKFISSLITPTLEIINKHSFDVIFVSVIPFIYYKHDVNEKWPVPYDESRFLSNLKAVFNTL